MKCIAMYLRLSIEDENDAESNSIRSQRKQIYEYIHHDSELSQYKIEEFCDDGYSGTNMERPSMQKMLKEVRENKIKCIIVKDMSRFSRDYIEMGTYLNQIFPFVGIRFIAINDNYDSRKHQGNTIEIDTAFQTLLYDLYSKDISVKVKAAFENKCANGEYAFGQVPFGYAKSKEVKNAVVVNEKEAKIVRYIFELALQGKSSIRIAKHLYDNKVPTAMQLRYPEKKYADGKIRSWSASAVRNILNNRFYVGEMIYGKTARKAVGSKGHIAVPKEEWKVIPNHHEALISEEIYEKVALFAKEHPAKIEKPVKQNCEKHPLTGKIYCGGCRYSLNYKPLKGRNKYRRFECRMHSTLQIPECCTYMNADLLEETVLFMLNKELMRRGDAMKQRQNLVFFQEAGMTALKKKLQVYRAELRQIRAKKDSLYEAYAFGSLGEYAYQKKAKEFTEQLACLAVKAEQTDSKLAALESEYRKTEEDMKLIIRYSHIEKLTSEVVDAFISKVYVYKNKKVEIEWSFSAGRKRQIKIT